MMGIWAKSQMPFVYLYKSMFLQFNKISEHY